MDTESRDLADILRGLRSDVDGLWGALRRGGGGGGGGGSPGQPGPPGAAAGFGTPSASASGLASGANPTASVVASGPDTAKIFAFSFGIPAGAQGPPGQPGGGGTAPTRYTYTNVAQSAALPVPAGSSYVRVRGRCRAASEIGNLSFRLNDDSTGNYFGGYRDETGNYTQSGVGAFPMIGVAAAPNSSVFDLQIWNTASTERTEFRGQGFVWAGSVNAPRTSDFGGTYTVTSALNSVRILAASALQTLIVDISAE